MVAMGCALTAALAHADNHEGYHSEIPGVGLWFLQPSFSEDAQNTSNIGVFRRLDLAENPEFFGYCNGKNKLFLLEMNGHPVVCETRYWERSTPNGWERHDLPPLSKIGAMRIPPKLQGLQDKIQYFVSLHDLALSESRLYTVSKKALAPHDWTVDSVSAGELRELSPFLAASIKRVMRHKDLSYRDVSHDVDRDIQKLANRPGTERYQRKFTSPGTDLFLLPMVYETHEIGGDLLSAVFLKTQGTIRQIGIVRGCLISDVVDVDTDGVPELLLETCENFEGVTVSYVKVLPSVRTLVSYSHE